MPYTQVALNKQTILVHHERPIDGPKIAQALRTAQTNLTQATLNTTKAYAFSSLPGFLTSLSDGYIDLLRTSFNLPPPDSADASTVYAEALRRINACISLLADAATAPQVEITEQEEAVEAVHPTAHGYVDKTAGEAVSAAFRKHNHDLSAAKPLVNPIHLKLADDANSLAWYWLHEASHKYALTDDCSAGGQKAYFDNIDRCAERTRFRTTCQLLRDAGSPDTVEQMMANHAFARKMRPFTSLQLLNNADSYSHYLMNQPAQIT